MMFSPLFFSSYLHLLEPAALYWASPPQLVHAWLPARENLPAWQGVEDRAVHDLPGWQDRHQRHV